MPPTAQDCGVRVLPVPCQLDMDLVRRAFDDTRQVVAIAADISVPSLGLDSVAYDELSRSVDVVIHVAAYVNHGEW